MLRIAAFHFWELTMTFDCGIMLDSLKTEMQAEVAE